MSEKAVSEQDAMSKIVSLCKRRGFVFQSSEIYGGLKSSYDYGPLGVELKRNIAAEWWRAMVYSRNDIVGLDASIVMHPKVWQASGHLANFSDPLVDCLNCRERFRADKAPTLQEGSQVTYLDGGKKTGQKKAGTVSSREYVCPQCGCPELSPERQFNGMFRTTLGPIDPFNDFAQKVFGQFLDKGEPLTREAFINMWQEINQQSSVYLRPETAQAMFVQFLNVQQTTSSKVPFGIAQIGKSFRNEIVVEHFIFRSCEFEQMEMEFFCEPGTQKEWLSYWTNERMNWYKKFLRNPDALRLRRHDPNELAHYSDDCYDIEYAYPWGWGELEGIASRTDYDLKKHAEASGVKLSYFDQQKTDPQTGKQGWRYVPYVIEPAAGLTRTVLCVLLDAYTEETITSSAPNGDGDGENSTAPKIRAVLKLHPRLAPFKAAILPLVKKDGQPEIAQKITEEFRKCGLNVSNDDQQSIGKRYAKHDEIGTPYCITIDQNTLTNQMVTVRFRDSMKQESHHLDSVVQVIQDLLRKEE